ncbi:MAG: hypothetical protein KGK07_04775 [Chloroflexota bacterium]|nr:hypothetical protein [Chloroflexota bacterium]
MSEGQVRAVEDAVVRATGVLPDGAIGIDAGLTLTKIARGRGDRIELSVHATSALGERAPAGGTVAGATGARIAHAGVEAAVQSEEIDAAVRGAVALLRAAGREAPPEFVLALAGTGTAFAAVRLNAGARGGIGRVSHLGGTALGGGSFEGIARRLEPGLDYAAMVTLAERGDRCRADLMIADAYPDGVGRVGPDLTAAHLAKQGDAGIGDVLAALLNLHGENIAQIAASRALVARMPYVLLAGGFVHQNPTLVAALTSMAAMFGVRAEAAPWPGFAGAVGAALAAVEASDTRMEV